MTRALMVLYAVFAIFAYGHAYHEQDGPTEMRPVGALLCAMAWPLYASVQLQKETP